MRNPNEMNSKGTQTSLSVATVALLPLIVILFAIIQNSGVRLLVSAAYFLTAYCVVRQMRLNRVTQILIALAGLVLLGAFIYKLLGV
jgi:hypothetical protein